MMQKSQKTTFSKCTLSLRSLLRHRDSWEEKTFYGKQNGNPAATQ
jgi:hypothetical protein